MSSRAIRMDRFAPSFREAADIVETPDAAPAPGEIAVRNLWCGVNAVFDTQIARNAVDYVKIGLPSFTGVEAIGLVEAAGEGVTCFRPGDHVITTRFGGGYRERNVAPADRFVQAPGPEREWLALASTGVSALLALEHVGEAKAGETVVISAAAGGLGHILVQLARLRGCHVIGIAGGAAKSAMIRELGADDVIDYSNIDIAEALAGRRIDVAIDTVSGTVFDAMLANMADHGRLVVAGAAQDLEGKPEIVTGPRIAHSIYYRGVSVRGFMNGLLTPLWPQARERMFSLYREGQLQLRFDDPSFKTLEGVYSAVERLLSRQSSGKVVVDLRQS